MLIRFGARFVLGIRISYCQKLKGAAKKLPEAFTDGTNVVTKHNVSWNFL